MDFSAVKIYLVIHNTSWNVRKCEFVDNTLNVSLIRINIVQGVQRTKTFNNLLFDYSFKVKKTEHKSMSKNAEILNYLPVCIFVLQFHYFKTAKNTKIEFHTYNTIFSLIFGNRSEINIVIRLTMVDVMNLKV